MQLISNSQNEREKATMTPGLLREEIAILCEECTERLVEIENDLLDIAQDRTAISQDVIGRIVRAFHSVEGAAAYLLHEPMKRLSHTAESVLGATREGKVAPTARLVEALLAAVSRLIEMVENVDRALEIDIHIELESLEAILKDKSSVCVESNLADDSVDLTGSVAKLSQEPSPSHRLKVLVVEDELTSRLVLHDLLSKYGDCHVAVNGSEAVEAFSTALMANKSYDLICMDVRMPGMGGTEAVRQIRAIEERERILSSRGTKIFMTTSIHDLKTITSSFKALCDLYLFKPIDGAKLSEHLRSFGLV